MKQGHCIEDTAGFAEGGDAGGQAGGKKRSTGAYRLPRGQAFSKKSLHQRIENQISERDSLDVNLNCSRRFK